MWILTRYGFFSAACAGQGGGMRSKHADPDSIKIRARIRGRIEALQKRFPELLGNCEIIENAGTDYAFRIFVEKSAWSQVLAGLGEETNYNNFKSEVARYQGKAGAAYERSLHDVWSVMYGLQN